MITVSQYLIAPAGCGGTPSKMKKLSTPLLKILATPLPLDNPWYIPNY